MESRKRARRAWFVESEDVPDGEVIVPIRTKSGDLALAVKPGEMTAAMFAGLNAVARHLVGVGLVHISDNEKPPERKE
ncbi:hypothetical protein [Streptomyces sp. NPDC021356]|uniref:hypothetical protein n=1 Tax=Streptomyces sp. NPDC021356 TaxID=3154900 RepID=UPI0033EA2DD2